MGGFDGVRGGPSHKARNFEGHTILKKSDTYMLFFLNSKHIHFQYRPIYKSFFMVYNLAHLKLGLLNPILT
ncbi:hypothetical protein Hanom_Chr14g01250661 [Helianthus anomalus]